MLKIKKINLINEISKQLKSMHYEEGKKKGRDIYYLNMLFFLIFTCLYFTGSFFKVSTLEGSTR